MNKNLVEKKFLNKPIVITDECGDSLWDEVLAQEARAAALKGDIKLQAPSLNRIDTVQECDASKVE